jgi:hypothetical protein
VLALVFLDELLLVAGAWVAAAAVRRALVRPVTQVLLLVAVCLGLWWTGHPAAALALAVFSVAINALALLPSVARLPQAAR